jgi:hypothetical protein
VAAVLGLAIHVMDIAASGIRCNNIAGLWKIAFCLDGHWDRK